MPRSEDPPEVAIVLARLEMIQAKIETKLEEIHAEAKRTNGRLTQLETAGKIEEALAAQARQQVIDHQASRSWVPGSLTAIVCVVLGAFAGHFIS